MTVARLAAVLLLCACARQPPAPPLPPGPAGLRQIAVAEPVNRTGHDLRVEERGAATTLVLPSNHATVPELLGLNLRTALAKRRFDVVAPKGPPPVLHVELGRWEPNTTDWSTVTVDLTATLVDPGSNTTLWSAARSGWVVSTSGADSQAHAFIAASRAVADALVAGWQPDRTKK